MASHSLGLTCSPNTLGIPSSCSSLFPVFKFNRTLCLVPSLVVTLITMWVFSSVWQQRQTWGRGEGGGRQGNEVVCAELELKVQSPAVSGLDAVVHCSHWHVHQGSVELLELLCSS